MAYALKNPLETHKFPGRAKIFKAKITGNVNDGFVARASTDAEVGDYFLIPRAGGSSYFVRLVEPVKLNDVLVALGWQDTRGRKVVFASPYYELGVNPCAARWEVRNGPEMELVQLWEKVPENLPHFQTKEMDEKLRADTKAQFLSHLEAVQVEAGDYSAADCPEAGWTKNYPRVLRVRHPKIGRFGFFTDGKWSSPGPKTGFRALENRVNWKEVTGSEREEILSGLVAEEEFVEQVVSMALHGLDE